MIESTPFTSDDGREMLLVEHFAYKWERTPDGIYCHIVVPDDAGSICVDEQIYISFNALQRILADAPQ